MTQPPEKTSPKSRNTPMWDELRERLNRPIKDKEIMDGEIKRYRAPYWNSDHADYLPIDSGMCPGDERDL